MNDTPNGGPRRRSVLGLMGAGAAGLALPLAHARGASAAPTGFYTGANLSGMEAGANVPGVPHTDYYVPRPEDLDYLRGRGLTTLRVPFKWERLQPSPGGALDATFLGFLRDLADQAAARGVGLILDVHNYGGYQGEKIGGGTVTPGHLADLWKRLAGELAGHTGVVAYDLMNEPSNMPAPGVWPETAQLVTETIRQVDPETTLYVEGDHWSSAASWVRVNGDLDIQDPSDNLVYSAHTYFDRDSSGVHYSWEEEVAAGDQLQDPPGELTTDIGVRRVTGFADWLREKGFRGQIGEVGTGNDHPAWLETLDRTLAFCQSRDIGVTYWTAGAWYRNYPMGIEPQADGRDTVQMAVLTKYSGGASPDVYHLAGPARGTEGAASAAFTVEYRGYHTRPLLITPKDGNAGGTFSPAKVTLAAGFNGSATFTYTAPRQATFAITAVNDGGLTDPAPVGYSTRDDPFADIDPEHLLNVLALGRVHTPYAGPALTLRRASDGAERDFGFTQDDVVSRASISSWAGGSDVQVVTLHDQGPAARHAGPVVTRNKNGPDGGQLDASPADHPLLVLDGPNGQPALRLTGSRMDAVSPIDGLTGFTCFAVCRPTTAGAMQRLLSWHFTEHLLIAGNASGTFQLTGEPELPLAVDPSAWHVHAVRWRGGDALSTWIDGEQVERAPAATETLAFQHDDHVNIGYFRWYRDVHFEGDVWALVPVATALSDAQLRAVTAHLAAATGIPVRQP